LANQFFTLDFVVAFQYKEEAEEFHKELKERLKEFGLEVAEEKTRVLRFNKNDKQGSSTFDFLGFEFRWIINKEGKDVITRRTSRKKFRAAVANFKDWIKRSRSFRLESLMKTLKAKYRGHGNYYGVIGNSKSLNDYYQQTQKLLYKWLNRRSQRLSYNWESFNQMLDSFGIEGPHIVEKRNV
jgi:RNA-directed DNA polymerase